jgi:ammonia channel protein AmtB
LNQAFGNGDYPGVLYASVDGKPSGALLGAQLVGILCIMGWSMATMMPFFVFVESKGLFRVAAQEELCGLDSTRIILVLVLKMTESLNGRSWS